MGGRSLLCQAFKWGGIIQKQQADGGGGKGLDLQPLGWACHGGLPGIWGLGLTVSPPSCSVAVSLSRLRSKLPAKVRV